MAISLIEPRGRAQEGDCVLHDARYKIRIYSIPKQQTRVYVFRKQDHSLRQRFLLPFFPTHELRSPQNSNPVPSTTKRKEGKEQIVTEPFVASFISQDRRQPAHASGCRYDSFRVLHSQAARAVAHDGDSIRNV